ncbi:hypothetical protein ABID22_002839 [Pontibacter aydingkolensis]
MAEYGSSLQLLRFEKASIAKDLLYFILWQIAIKYKPAKV